MDPNTDPNKYVLPGEASKYCGYSLTSLRNWAESGKIRFIRAQGGRRKYYLPDIQHWCGIQDSFKGPSDPNSPKRTVLYARIRFAEKRSELSEQIRVLQEHYPEGSVISEVGSSINYNRRGLQRLLGEISSGSVGQVVVTETDRLCRFGSEFLEWIFRENNVQLVVLGEETSSSRNEELAKDILDICEVLSNCHNQKKCNPFREKERARRNNKNQDDSSPSEQIYETDNLFSDGSVSVPIQSVRTVVVRRTSHSGKSQKDVSN